jgi:hypothetical protein
MAPELHGTPWGIIETGLIREAQRHCSGGPFEELTAPRAVSYERLESTVEVQDGSINALIGTEGDGVFVAEVRDLQSLQRGSFVEARQAMKIVSSGHIATPVHADLG